MQSRNNDWIGKLNADDERWAVARSTSPDMVDWDSPVQSSDLITMAITRQLLELNQRHQQHSTPWFYWN